MILALASVVNYDRQSDAPIWSVTSSSINYDRNKFIKQATGFTYDRHNIFCNTGHWYGSSLIEGTPSLIEGAKSEIAKTHCKVNLGSP